MIAAHFALAALLDDVVAQFDAGSVEPAFEGLVCGLATMRRKLGAMGFADLGMPACRAHSLHARLAVDPFTRRARQRPPTMGTDSVLQDLVFHGGWDSSNEPCGEEGRRLFHCTAVRSDTAISIRERRNFLGAQLDEACARRPNSRILAVGCGHLREASRS